MLRVHTGGDAEGRIPCIGSDCASEISAKEIRAREIEKLGRSAPPNTNSNWRFNSSYFRQAGDEISFSVYRGCFCNLCCKRLEWSSPLCSLCKAACPSITCIGKHSDTAMTSPGRFCSVSVFSLLLEPLLETKTVCDLSRGCQCWSWWRVWIRKRLLTTSIPSAISAYFLISLILLLELT